MIKKWDLIYELRAENAAVEPGSCERRIAEGTITEAKPTSMPARQEFRMRTDDGSELTGVRHGNPMRYVEGLRIRVEYASAPQELVATEGVIVAVWIEHSHKRTPFLHSFYPSPPAPI
jgi:hypothetical protein